MKKAYWKFGLALVLLVALMTLGTLVASAAEVTEGYFTYDDHSLVRVDPAISGDVVIPSTFNGETITIIEKGAFQGCQNITSVVIPDGVRYIFSGAFGGCTGMKSITLPSTLDRIYKRAFMSCTALESIVIPESVTDIEYEVFYGCTALKSVTIHADIARIDELMFAYCTSLTEVIFPAGLKSIDDKAFASCTALEHIELPGMVGSISRESFRDCTNLKSVTIWGAVGVEHMAFYGCDQLEKITFMASEQSIDGRLAIPETVVIYGIEGSGAQAYAQEFDREFVVLTCDHVRVKDEAVAATCVDDGLSEGEHCSTCGEVFVAQQLVPATGVHTFGEWVVTFPANYVDEGEEMRECAHCDASEMRTIPVLTVTDEPQGDELPDQPWGGDQPEQPSDVPSYDEPDNLTGEQAADEGGAPVGWIVAGAAVAVGAAGVVLAKKKKIL